MHEYRVGERLLAWYLSCITGFIDAVGFIYLGGFFLSFMSGNTTRMTAAAAEGVWATAGKAAGLMGLFLCGVMLGALIQRAGMRTLQHGRPREVVLGFVVVATLTSAAFVAFDNGTAAMLALSFAVGAMNSTFERNGEVSISLTYATGTLVKMAQRFVGAFFGEGHAAWVHNALLWLSLATGSILGGLCYTLIGLRTVWVVAALVTAGFAVTMAVRQHRRRRGLPL